MLDIADKITVLRDGQYVDTLVNDNLTEDDLIRRMVGRDLALAEVAGRNAPADTPVALAVDGLSLPGKLETCHSMSAKARSSASLDSRVRVLKTFHARSTASSWRSAGVSNCWASRCLTPHPQK